MSALEEGKLRRVNPSRAERPSPVVPLDDAQLSALEEGKLNPEDLSVSR
ncbi:hypothetical protein [Pseudomonas syringae]|nr:hypothetical protein [Pseudomonas syringae]